MWAIYTVDADGGAHIEEVYPTELDALRANKNNTDPARKVQVPAVRHRGERARRARVAASRETHWPPSGYPLGFAATPRRLHHMIRELTIATAARGGRRRTGADGRRRSGSDVSRQSGPIPDRRARHELRGAPRRVRATTISCSPSAAAPAAKRWPATGSRTSGRRSTPDSGWRRIRCTASRTSVRRAPGRSRRRRRPTVVRWCASAPRAGSRAR